MWKKYLLKSGKVIEVKWAGGRFWGEGCGAPMPPVTEQLPFSNKDFDEFYPGALELRQGKHHGWNSYDWHHPETGELVAV